MPDHVNMNNSGDREAGQPYLALPQQKPAGNFATGTREAEKLTNLTRFELGMNKWNETFASLERSLVWPARRSNDGQDLAIIRLAVGRKGETAEPVPDLV